MKIRRRKSDKRNDAEIRADLARVSRRPEIRGRLCGPDCMTVCPTCSSTVCDCNCSSQCPDISDRLTSDPSFPIEGNSAQFARVVVQKVWRAAARLGYEDVFPESVGIPLGDDHIPLIEAGLLTANVIDFTYGGPLNPYWHTPQDIPSNVSASTLAIVGEVMIELIYSGG